MEVDDSISAPMIIKKNSQKPKYKKKKHKSQNPLKKANQEIIKGLLIRPINKDQ